jgi:hypothetical protein
MKFTVIVFVCSIFACCLSQSQPYITSETTDSVWMKAAIPKDTLPNFPKPSLKTCFSYKFIPKDTLIYGVISKDSIAIDYGAPINKLRKEVLQVVCDSVGSNGHYYLNLKLIGYSAEESEGDDKPITHSNSEWINRIVYLEIDSVGERYSINYDDSTMVGLSPGGAFQPSLFFTFTESCQDTAEAWTRISVLEHYPENGLPCPSLFSTYLYNNRGYLDTLNHKVNRVEFVRTAQGSITYSAGPKSSTRVTSIIASSGTMDIGLDNKVPIHFFNTMEQKLTIHQKNGVEKPGKHYITTYFTLNQYLPCKDINHKKNNKKKRNK